MKMHIDQLLDQYQSGFSLAKEFYTDADIHELDWKNIWSKQWLFAGTVAEIPKAGDFFTYQLGNDSIIIIRGDKGEVFAHYNTCRHRGSLICLEAQGNAPKLMCPYHQWVYNKDGSLFRARLMEDDFDKTAYGLWPVPLQVVEGLIFVCLSQQPPDFSPIAEGFAPYVKPFQIDRAKVAFQKRYTLRTNWKLIAENFRECYHCGPAHPEYCSAVVGANLREDSASILAEKQIEWRSKGLAVEGIPFDNGSLHFAVRYPLRPGVETYSLDGKAVAPPMGLHKDHDAGVLGLVVYPNFWMDAVSDYVWTMRITATSASQCIVDLAWLVDGAAKEGVDYDVEKLTAFWKITGEQDWKLCENNFKGIESSHYTPGPYAPAEDEVIKFADWYIDQLRSAVDAHVLG